MPPKIYIALPLMDELENLPQLMRVFLEQDYKNFEIHVCVNQPDSWWENFEKIKICGDNQKSLEFLKSYQKIPIHIIDKSSKGKGWDTKNFGVGWARKVLMDKIAAKAQKEDIILTLDGDTSFNFNYFSSLIKTIRRFPKAVALSVPYYHPLSGNEETDRHILRYELYMRYYSLNMWRINNPYNFTALGSAIAVPVWAYQRVRGITPHKSGEDFYFLLKLRKFGNIINWNPEKVYPDGRYSDRVFFGTGPAMIKGRSGDWSSYPFYHFNLFDEVGESFKAFSDLFEQGVDFPMKSFLHKIFKNENWFFSLRKNYPSHSGFIKACTNKVDALRILQYLKSCQKERNESDVGNFVSFLKSFYPNELPIHNLTNLDFDQSPVSDLNLLRDFLAHKEEKYQKNVWNQ